MSTHQQFVELIKSLTASSVFYLPASFVNEQVRGMFEKPLDPYMNTLLYVTPKAKIKPLAMPMHLHKLIAKRVLLEENLLEFADFKEGYGKRKFKYLIDRYLLFLNAFCFYSEILHVELKDHFPNADANTSLAFKLQYHNLLDHRNSIVEVCNIKKLKPFSLEDFTLLGSMDTPLFTAENLLQSTNTNPTQPQSEEATGSIKHKGLISEKEIEKFLLESVFKIKQ